MRRTPQTAPAEITVSDDGTRKARFLHQGHTWHVVRQPHGDVAIFRNRRRILLLRSRLAEDLFYYAWAIMFPDEFMDHDDRRRQ